MKRKFDEGLLNSVVKVSSGESHGTAFFVSEHKLLTACHVVMPSINNVQQAVCILYRGQEHFCMARRLREGCDIAVLTCSDVLSPKPICLLKTPFSKDSSLSATGFPRAASGGNRQMTLSLRYNHEVDETRWNQEAAVTEDTSLKNFKGLSGAPILNSYGTAVGVAIKQIDDAIGFLSLSEIEYDLKGYGIGVSVDWQRESDGIYGFVTSKGFSLEKVARAKGRYEPGLHVPDYEMESALAEFCDYELEKRLNAEVEGAKEEILRNPTLQPLFSSYCQDNIPQMLADYDQDSNPAIENGHYKAYSKLDSGASSLLKRNISILKKNSDKIEKRVSRRFMLLKGKAGVGKTHIVCHFVEFGKTKANIYLFFGSDFNCFSSLQEQICALLDFPKKDGLENLNEKMDEWDTEAVIIIDALNEGCSDKFWKAEIERLHDKLLELPRLRLIITTREPFNKMLEECLDSSWLKRDMKGFRSVKNAVRKYFSENGIPQENCVQYAEFSNPLFLKIYCMTYHRLSAEERQNADRMLLYRHFLAMRNESVSVFIDEDSHRNITEKYIRKLCAHSIFYLGGGLVSREKARDFARQICPGRLWSKDLLHAMINESLLLETLSDDLEVEQVMLEFENIADFYKADALLHSKMDGRSLVQFLIGQKRRIDRDKKLNQEKFRNCIRALLSLWKDETLDLLEHRPFMENFADCLPQAKDYSGIYQERIKEYCRNHQEQMDPSGLLSSIENGNYSEVAQAHAELRGLKSNEIDYVWTTQVDMESDWGSLNQGEQAFDPDDNEGVHAYVILQAWLMACSHPLARSRMKRRLYRFLKQRPEAIFYLMEQMYECNDMYVLEGVYGVAYGLVITSNDADFANKIARVVFSYYYSNKGFAPEDVQVRQWTLKILERAHYLDPTSPYWEQSQPPYKFTQDPLKMQLDEEIGEEYFGTSQGSWKMRESVIGFSDFNRYVIGTNSRIESSSHFQIDAAGNVTGLPLEVIERMICKEIVQMGWSDMLGKYDDMRNSFGRFYNETERIGKKYQWKSLFRIEALLMDHLPFVNPHRYVYMPAKDDFCTPYPWYSKHRSYFDVTLPTLQEQKEMLDNPFSRMPVQDIDDTPNRDWVANPAIRPEIRPILTDNAGEEWVVLYRWQSVEKKSNEGTKGLHIFYFPALVDNGKADAFARWASRQNFYGRWMPEHRNGENGVMWNEFPWSDSFKSLPVEQQEPGKGCPCEVMLPYEEFLQEDSMGIDDETEGYVSTVHAPSAEIMNFLGLYVAERGIVRRLTDDKIIALNLEPFTHLGTGIAIRRKELNDYLKENQKTLFYTHVGEKTINEGIMSNRFDIRRYTAATQYNQEGAPTILQPMTDEDDYNKSYTQAGGTAGAPA